MASGRLLTKRNLQLALVAAWLLLTLWIASVPYEPMEWDLADATTNYIWTREYARGVYHLPFEEWNASGYPPTQSSIVVYQDDVVVVNEKGPGHALMIVPFYLLGAEALFGPLLAGLAVLSTYVLGHRLFSWRVGFVAAAAVLVNTSVLTMWHRFYWTDASTMPLLAASAALLVEALYRANGRSLDPRGGAPPFRRDRVLALGLSSLGGIAFGASVSTRYPTAVVLPAFLLYLTAFGLVATWPQLRRREIRNALRALRPLALVLPFFLGLMVVLVPLMQYNTTYFGGPFRSGYDATSLLGYSGSQALDARNQTESWIGSPAEGIVIALRNAVVLAPLLVFRMPLLVFLPLALWFLRRHLVLALLLPWLVLAFYTYLSLDWVVRYARPDVLLRIPWEPRYFMPALPAISLLGGWVVERLACGDRLFRRLGIPQTAWKSVAVAVLLLLPAVFCGIVPVAGSFRDPSAGGRPGGPGPTNAVTVTTDMLSATPQEYGGKFVRLEDAVVVQTTAEGALVRSPGSAAAAEVRLFNWPPPERPALAVGVIVDVQGRFNAGPPNFLGVGWQTADYLRVVG